MGRFESIGAIQPFLKIQEGEWADVYKAYDTALDRNVLLKRLKSEFEGDENIARRFEEEARLMAQVHHPNIVSVLSSSRSENAVYFIAEFIEGQSVDALLQGSGLPVQLSAHILREVASGLKAAHDKNIFHRDIKPSNILISNAGEVKLTDFGMASLMDASDNDELRGTLGYIAPELVVEGEPSILSDLFSLGATLFEILTGQAAFHGETPSEIFDRVLNHDPLPLLAANPLVHPDVLKICRTLLHKEPPRRYANCDRLIEEIDAFLDKIPAFVGSSALLTFLDNPDGYKEPVIIQEAVNIPATTGSTDAVLSAGFDSNKRDVTPLPIYKKQSVRRAGALLSIAAGIVLLLSFFDFNLFNTNGLPDNAGAELAVSLDTADSNISAPDTQRVDFPASFETLSNLDIPAPELNTPQPQVIVPQNSASEEVARTDTTIKEPAALSDLIGNDLPQTETQLEAPGELNIICTPFCDVMIDDILKGSAPPMISVQLTPGIHQIALINPNLPAYENAIVIQSGQSDSLKIALKDLVGTVELNVVPWAEVYINSVYHGEIPPSKSFTLKPGDHTLLFENTTLGTWTTTIIVAAGEKQSYSFNLKELLGK